MTDDNKWGAVARALASVDWLRLGTKLVHFARELRGDDPEVVQRESLRAREQARSAKESLDQVARQAAGCIAPAPCTCIICRPTQEGK
jgi:hypothetical protein